MRIRRSGFAPKCHGSPTLLLVTIRGYLTLTYAEDIPQGGQDGLQVELGGLRQVGVLTKVLQAVKGGMPSVKRSSEDGPLFNLQSIIRFRNYIVSDPRFISVRIRILGAKQMRIYADPDNDQNLLSLNFIFLFFRTKMPVLGSKIFLVVTVCTLYKSIYLKFVHYPLIF